MRRCFAILLVALWWGSALAAPPYDQFARQFEHDLAFGFYLQGQKAGYLTSKAELGSDGKALKWEQTNVMRVAFGDHQAVNQSTELSYYDLETGELTGFRWVGDSNGDRLTRTGRKVGDELEIVTESPTQKTTRTVPLPRENLEEMERLHRFLQGGQPGDQLTVYEADWERDPVDIPSHYTIVSRRDGVVTVDMESDDLTMRGTVDAMGQPLELSVGTFLQVKREPVEVATQLDSGADVFGLTGIQLDRSPGGRPLERLVLLTQGADNYKWLETGWQQVESDYLTGRKRLVLTRPSRPEPESLTAEERQKYLAASPVYEVEAPAIAALLQSLGVAQLDDAAKVKKLNHWVFQMLAKTYTRDAGTATEVLAHRAGDCTEHSLLLITLYRAAGLPARPLSGLGYDSGTMMAHHAWVEVYFDGGWLAVDPSFDQVPADAGHVFFDRDEGLSGFAIAGSLKLEVEAYEGPSGSYHRPPDLRLLGVGLLALFLFPLLGGPVALALWVHFTQD